MPNLEDFIVLTLTVGSIISLPLIVFLIKWLWFKNFSKLQKSLIGTIGCLAIYLSILALSGYILHFWY